MRSPDFKTKLLEKCEETINLLEKNGVRYGDDMLNLFKEQYPLMHITAKCCRVKNMIPQLNDLLKQEPADNDTSEAAAQVKIKDLKDTIEEETRDIIGYSLLLWAIEQGLIK